MMEKDREWGDHRILQVLANILSRNILVVRHDGETTIEARNPIAKTKEPFFLGYLASHYYSLEPGKRMRVN